MEKTNYKLPAINQIIGADLVALSQTNDLNILLNQKPNPKWLKTHPLVKGLVYIPIERIEYLLTAIFFKWKVEIKQTQLIGNSVAVSIRLHYFNIVDNEWQWQDGIGASPLQTDKGAGAIDFNKLKAGAVMMAAPAAESYAVKDAAEKIGSIFGKDLNRSDKLDYDSLANNLAFKKEEKLDKMFNEETE